MLAAALLLAQADTSPNSRAMVQSSVRQAAPGVPFNVAVRIDLDKGWHTYWSNPGDSGSATNVVWKLPKGWKVSPPRFAAPHRIVTGDIVSYGYDGRANVFFTVTPPANAKTAVLKAEADWLVCQESCVPARQSLTLKVPVGKAAVKGTDFAKDWAKLPHIQPGMSFTAWPTEAGYGLRLEGAGPVVKPESAYFFASDAGVLNHGVPQTFRQSTDALEADLAKSPYATAGAKRLRGVLVLYEGGPAYLVDVPVSKKE
ncbi:MAG: protein-disulfide reductase DsbD domain-containing protein [Fimbriimonas sp.]